MSRTRVTETRMGKFEALEIIPRGNRSKTKYACRCTECVTTVLLSSFQFYRSNARCPTCQTRNREMTKERALKMTFHSYKQNAKKRGHPFHLNFNEFLVLVEANCHYCGAKPTNIAQKVARYNGIDRKVNELGYVSSNCVTCCKFCNFAKRNFGYEEFLAWINNIKEAVMR